MSCCEKAKSRHVNIFQGLEHGGMGSDLRTQTHLDPIPPTRHQAFNGQVQLRQLRSF